tara:strand:+ start:955 stop:1206 length:252 start_codon:yes stop_codon:yes gene_type:complete
LYNLIFPVVCNQIEENKGETMNKVLCITCEQIVMEEDATIQGYYGESWECLECNELAQTLADEGLTVAERVQAMNEWASNKLY